MNTNTQYDPVTQRDAITDLMNELHATQLMLRSKLEVENPDKYNRGQVTNLRRLISLQIRELRALLEPFTKEQKSDEPEVNQ